MNKKTDDYDRPPAVTPEYLARLKARWAARIQVFALRAVQESAR